MAELIHNPAPRAAILKGMDQIIPNLWLGDIMSTYSTERLQEYQITLVLSLVDRPLPDRLRTEYQREGIKHLELHVEDDELEDILKILADVCDVIEREMSTGSAVLVHCGLGISRSGSAVIAYLMRSRKLSRDEAFALAKRSRTRVQPNAGFWKQLEIWEACNFNVWEEVDGERREKLAYKEWKEGAEERMKERIRGFQK